MPGSSYFEQISTTEGETQIAPAVMFATAAILLALVAGLLFRLVVFVL